MEKHLYPEKQTSLVAVKKQHLFSYKNFQWLTSNPLGEGEDAQLSFPTRFIYEPLSVGPFLYTDTSKIGPM